MAAPGECFFENEGPCLPLKCSCTPDLRACVLSPPPPPPPSGRGVTSVLNTQCACRAAHRTACPHRASLLPGFRSRVMLLQGQRVKEVWTMLPALQELQAEPASNRLLPLSILVPPPPPPRGLAQTHNQAGLDARSAPGGHACMSSYFFAFGRLIANQFRHAPICRRRDMLPHLT